MEKVILKRTLSYSQMADFLLKNTKEASDLYFDKEFTARELAEHYKIIYNVNFQKACIRVLGVKGKGLGGSRTGAGNRKADREERRARKKYFEVITIKLSQNSIDFLKTRKDNYTNTIEKALLFYEKAVKIIENGKEEI